MPEQPLVIRDYRPAWVEQFREVAAALRSALGDEALRIDHIGSTAVPGLGAKDVVDIQVTVRRLADADRWPDELLVDVVRRSNSADHVPAGVPQHAREWAKRYWSTPQRLHVHVREHRRLNQRYALVFRDYLRATPTAAAAYEELKRALAASLPNDRGAYTAVKDPACDLIVAAAEQWAEQTGWSAPDPDA